MVTVDTRKHKIESTPGIERYCYVGKNVPRVDAEDKVTGQAIYSSDIYVPGMLFGKCKRSPHPSARILSIDISKASKLRGVRAVITAGNITQSYFGEFFLDQLPLCDQYAHYVGDEVAAVAAVDEDIAEEAVDLIEVEYELLPPVFDAEKALYPEAPEVRPELEFVERNIAMRVDFERGEGEAAFKDAEIILEDRFTTQPQHQCYMQPRDCIAAWNRDRLTLWAVMQSPYRMRPPLARAVGIPEAHIRIIPCYVGGGFGNNASRIWPIAALLAKKAGKPVKIVLTREEEFISGRPFPSSIVDIRMGFKNDGTMVAKKMDLIIDAGGYVGSCRGITVVASSRADNLYRLRNIKTSAKLVYTNNIPRGALRGYGTQLMIFPLESIIDMAAEKLDIDPAEIRLKNIAQKGDVGPHGFIFNSCGLGEAINSTTEKSGWKQKREERKENYGIGLANAIHSAGALVMELKRVCSGSGAIVRVDEHGKVLVISGETDIGQGSTTVFAQIAAEEMGVKIEDVRVLPADTDVSLFALGTFGDRLTVLGGHAVLKGVADAKKQILRHAARIFKIKADELELKNSEFYIKGSAEPLATLQELASNIVNKRSGVPIVGKGNYVVPSYVVPQSEKNKYYGNYSLAYAFINQVAEVKVDAETGKVDVLDIWIGQDVGKAINPKMCEGQIEGAAMMGIGYALGEGYIVDNGKILNPNFTDYRMPTSQSIPRIHISLIETIDPNTPYGAKGAGEASMNPVAATIANAVYNATGVRIKDLPFTPEKMLKALKEKSRRQEQSQSG